MADINLKGMGVALITPFKEDESVDYEALGKLIMFFFSSSVSVGVSAVVPSTTK